MRQSFGPKARETEPVVPDEELPVDEIPDGFQEEDLPSPDDEDFIERDVEPASTHNEE